MKDTIKYVLSKVLEKCEGELRDDLIRGYIDYDSRELKGRYFKLKYVNVGEVILLEQKPIGWTYLCNIKI